MKPKAKEVIYLIIDDTRIEKRGRTMEAVTKIYDHKTLRFVRGHIVVTAALMFRGVVMPWKIVLWIPRSNPRENPLKPGIYEGHPLELASTRPAADHAAARPVRQPLWKSSRL
jgi:hypothetical protein